ncbi:hypothetical protein Nepgr_003090 [Nepenthes gracilis]|uniref:Uncharacterized protein n=1 Tax=Nepenthes gracilis TaxID=150966 RepID=A0AAD3RYU8_NEPGR|nr:hypothetical protein Nepgr_003090 [Nepenthes gracilis]
MGRQSSCDNQKLRKGLWSPEEDEKLLNYITRFGVNCWSSVPKSAGLQRCGKSCRLRWLNYLRPDLKRGMFSQQEEDLIIDLHKVLGNRWAQIAAQIPGRTDNEIKNFWNSFLKKKLMRQGIDPATHLPISKEEARDEKNSIAKASSPLFLPQSNIKTEQPFFMNSSSFVNHGDEIIRPVDEAQFETANSFGFSLPSLENLENGENFPEKTDFSDNSTAQVSSILYNEGKESSSSSSNIDTAAICWDFPEKKLQSLFHYNHDQIYGLTIEEDRKLNPWQNSDEFSYIFQQIQNF